MKNRKMSSSMKAMREMGKNGGLKSFMNGGDVTDSLIKAQKGVEIDKLEKEIKKFKIEQRAKDSVATRNKLIDKYWNQPSVRNDPFQDRGIWEATDVYEPAKEKFVNEGMAKKGYGPKKKK